MNELVWLLITVLSVLFRNRSISPPVYIYVGARGWRVTSLVTMQWFSKSYKRHFVSSMKKKSHSKWAWSFKHCNVRCLWQSSKGRRSVTQQLTTITLHFKISNAPKCFCPLDTMATEILGSKTKLSKAGFPQKRPIRTERPQAATLLLPVQSGASQQHLKLL